MSVIHNTGETAGIKNIVFDVGMVLIDFCWEKVCRKLGFEEQLIKDFAVNMVYSDYWGKLDEGLITVQDMIEDAIRVMPQYEAEIRLFWEHSAEFVEEYDYAAPLVEELQKRGYKVYLLSNYPEEMYELHFPSFCFYPMVDGYIISAPNRMVKPNPEIYQLLLSKYNLKAEECLFFDDRQENVDAAINVGMQAVLFEGYDTVKNRLSIM